MTPKMWVCEYGQVHNQTKADTPVRLVVAFPCTSKRKHKAVMEQIRTEEIDHEVKVETLLYSLEVLDAKYDMEPELIIDLANITNSLRDVLDHEAKV